MQHMCRYHLLLIRRRSVPGSFFPVLVLRRISVPVRILRYTRAQKSYCRVRGSNRASCMPYIDFIMIESRNIIGDSQFLNRYAKCVPKTPSSLFLLL